MSKNWIIGWGNGLTGPTTACAGDVFCGGNDWEYVPISYGQSTIALVPKQEGENGLLLMHKHSRLIAAAPDLLEALEMMISTIPPYRENGECTIPDTTIKIVNAAIKKATQ